MNLQRFTQAGQFDVLERIAAFAAAKVLGHQLKRLEALAALVHGGLRRMRPNRDRVSFASPARDGRRCCRERLRRAAPARSGLKSAKGNRDEEKRIRLL